MGHHHQPCRWKSTDPVRHALASLHHAQAYSPVDHGRRDFLGIVLAAMLFTILLACGAGECALHVVDVDASRRAARAEHLLQNTLEAVSAYPFEAIAKLDGAARASEARVPVDPDFDVDLGVTNVRNGLLRIEAVVVDSATRQEMGKFVTYRRRS